VNIRPLQFLAAASGLVFGLGACSIMQELQPGNQFDLEVGTCFDTPAKTSAISEVPTIDCAEAHDAEIIWKGPSSVTGDYRREAIEAAATEKCGVALVEYVGANWIDLDLKAGYFYPDATAWGNDQRTILCYAQTENSQPTLMASVKDKGI